jgi:hypothetical protein
LNAGKERITGSGGGPGRGQTGRAQARHDGGHGVTRNYGRRGDDRTMERSRLDHEQEQEILRLGLVDELWLYGPGLHSKRAGE